MLSRSLRYLRLDDTNIRAPKQVDSRGPPTVLDGLCPAFPVLICLVCDSPGRVAAVQLQHATVKKLSPHTTNSKVITSVNHNMDRAKEERRCKEKRKKGTLP